MKRNADMWRDYVVSIDCPLCEAKTGEHCFVKPGKHLLDGEGMVAGFHAKRLLDALKLDGVDAKITPVPSGTSTIIN